MSSIIFEGNTYIFGATVSANPGTGTTSYVFGGLNSGSTYGFIIWAFNGFGPSSIVGPVNYKTLSSFEEQREMISIMSSSWPAYLKLDGVNVYKNRDPNSINLLPESNNLLTGTIEQGRYYVSSGSVAPISNKSGFTAPDGSTTAYEMVSPPSQTFMIGLNAVLETGYTYYISYYHDLGRGAGTTGMFAPQLYYPNPTRGIQVRQILPVVGSFGSGQLALYPTGPTAPTGWTRFAYEFYASTGITGNNFISMILLGPQSGKTGYFWGPQLEKAL